MATKQPAGPVKRWLEAGQESPLDAELGELFRALEHEQPLSAHELGRVGQRLAQGRLGVGAPRRRAFPQLMLAFAVLVGASGAAFAQWKRPGFWHLQGSLVQHAKSSPSRSTRPPSAVGQAQRSLGTQPESSTAPAVDSAQASAGEPEPTAATPLARPSVSGAKPVRARQSSLARESELLQKALAKLRREHNAAAALVLLDQYQAEFPRGELLTEASVARIDALLLSGRRGEALGLLSRQALDGAGRPSELRLLRAELYAERDCGRALADFDSVLATGGGTGLNERALYGRAACRLRLGDAGGGQADLERYLRSYPAGRFAEQVRARLAPP